MSGQTSLLGKSQIRKTDPKRIHWTIFLHNPKLQCSKHDTTNTATTTANTESANACS